MGEVEHREIEVGGLRMHVAEQGASGPLVVLLHGFPESWYSWRHQLAALADAGFRAVAPDQRGYGRTDRPEDAERYTLLDLVGDVVGLIDVLGEERAIVIGHDWGVPVAWHTALLRPDRVAGVAGLSVPSPPRRVGARPGRPVPPGAAVPADGRLARGVRRPLLPGLLPGAGRRGGRARGRRRRDDAPAAHRRIGRPPGP